MFKCSVSKRLGVMDLSCSLEVENNRLLVILGPSGCGKTSLMNLITGIIQPDKGMIAIEGQTVFDRDKGRNDSIGSREIGYIQQGAYLFAHMTVKENILYSIPKGKWKNHDNKYKALLKLLKLERHELVYPSVLSGGQKQRVAIGRALMMSPKLILWDEPFSALDHSIRSEMRLLVKTVKKDLGVPMIFVTHDLDEAYDLADDLAVMLDGKLLQHGKKEAVVGAPVSHEVKRLIGLDAHRPLVIGISGVSNSGKTTVVEKLVKGLSSKGFKVGTIKHHGHGFEIDHEGKDSYRHKAAGADRVILASSRKYAVVKSTEEEMSLESFIEMQADMDIVLFEGYKMSPYRKYEVVRKGVSDHLVCDPKTLYGIITDHGRDWAERQTNEAVSVFDLSDMDGVMAEIQELMKEHKRERH